MDIYGLKFNLLSAVRYHIFHQMYWLYTYNKYTYVCWIKNIKLFGEMSSDVNYKGRYQTTSTM